MLRTMLFLAICLTATILLRQPEAMACTRAVYIGEDGMVVTGRSMDWANEMHTNLWAFPRGIERHGLAGENSITWTSKYGSVGAAGFEAGIADGLNEKGLVANMLYLTESEYPTPQKDDPRQPLAISLWVQYMLDNFATVEEAVEAMRAEPFYIVTRLTPDGKPGQMHLSISDATGDSAIFQYVGGKLTIHHSRNYQVMTNSPIYSEQIALNRYWQEIGGLTMLPGTNRAADRFVRASFYINAIPKTSEPQLAVAGVLSVIRNASVPMGITTPGRPNISSTIWRTVADQKNKRYYFESVRTPNLFWVDLADLDLREGSPQRRLPLTGGQIYAGNVADKFEEHEPLKFLPSTPPAARE